MGARSQERTEGKRRKEMNRQSPFFLFPVVFLLLWGCDWQGGGLPEDVLVQVNQEQVTVDQFNSEFKELMLDPGGETKENFGDIKRAYLDQVIERKILAQEARRLGMRISPQELGQAVTAIRGDYPGEGFGEKLVLKGVSFEKWKFQLEEKLLAEKMVQNAQHYPGEIDEKEAVRYYEAHVSSFRLSQRVRARQIVVADGEEAIQILKGLKKGESFEKMAMERSLGPEKAMGGDLGYFSQGERPVEFDRVFTMETGAISEVIKSPYGYHIFKLEEKIPGRQIPFEEARAGILYKLKQEKGAVEYRGWLEELKRKAIVKVNKKWFQS